MTNQSSSRLFISFLLFEITSLLLISLVVFVFEIHGQNNKASVLFDTLRNDYILSDFRSLNQKMQMVISQHEFLEIEFEGLPALNRPRKILETKVLDYVFERAVLANVADPDSKVGYFHATYSLANGVFFASLIWLIVTLVYASILPVLKRKIELDISRKYELLRKEGEFNLAKQVAHDIRSPLSALRISVDKICGSVEEKNLIVLAMDRINAIANDLLDTTRPKSFECKVQRIDVLDVVSRLIQEKNTTSGGVVNYQFEDLPKSIFISGDAGKFQRAISNIIENAIEAIYSKEDGRVDVCLRVDGEQLSISIVDNGQGMPENILSQIGTRGLTFGKTSGNGLGLHYSISVLESMNGRFQILSKQGVGTVASVILGCIIGTG